jgi:hypothetical protein
MFEWKVEDMTLMNERGRIIIGSERIYGAESKASREEKILFVDSFNECKLSYLLGLIDKFNEDSKTMPKDSYGNVKTVSLKAWIGRNDTKYPRPILATDYHHGQYYLLGCKRNILYNHKGQFDFYDDLVDELFHRQLKKCEEMERAYFAEHDELSILRKAFMEKYEKYNTTFGVQIAICSNNVLKVLGEEPRQERELTIDEIKKLIGKYEQIEALVAKLTAETTIEY